MITWNKLFLIASQSTATLLLSVSIPLSASANAFANVFEDVSETALGIQAGATAASAWGDANSDGWPDLWISNHHGRAPALLINQRDGTFSDNAHTLDIFERQQKSGWPDYHGAAWADFDNDGDQDLIVLTGGGAGRGSSASQLFVNQGNSWVESAEQYALAYPLGRGRTPLWFDANSDGELDLLVMNKHRKSAPSALFLRTDTKSFEKTALLAESPTTWWSQISGFFAEVFGLQDEPMVAAVEFPLMIGPLKVLTFDRNTKLRSFDSAAAGVQTAVIESALPEGIRSIQDAVAADFDGDLLTDLFLVRSQTFTRDISRDASGRLHAVLNGTPDKPAALELSHNRDLPLSIYRPWRDPSDPLVDTPLTVLKGDTLLQLSTEDYVFTRESSIAKKPEQTGAAADAEKALAVNFDPSTGTWRITNTSGPLNLIIGSDTPVGDYSASGFKTSTGALADALLHGTAQGFETTQTAFAPGACQSVVAADFDNDTDIDLYLTCSEPTRNTADFYLENSGDGTFSAYPQALVMSGRGNQVATADFDNDGFIDLAVTNGAGAPPWSSAGSVALLRNRGNSNSWLEIDLQGTVSNRDGIGAEVLLWANGKQQKRLQDGGVHSFSQNHSRLHFGLGDAKAIDKVLVRWPSGIEQTLINLDVNQRTTIIETDHSADS